MDVVLGTGTQAYIWMIIQLGVGGFLTGFDGNLTCCGGFVQWFDWYDI